MTLTAVGCCAMNIIIQIALKTAKLVLQKKNAMIKLIGIK
jgi:hypothetical protein